MGSGAWLGAADAAALGLQAIGEVSERDGRGKHTTRHVSLLQARARPRARRPDRARQHGSGGHAKQPNTHSAFPTKCTYHTAQGP
jgi:hypothetical protein